MLSDWYRIVVSADDDRPRGMLAPVDRAFLRGEKEYDHRQSIYDRRETIKKRIQHTLLDFSLLIEHMSEEDRKRVFTWVENQESEYQFGVYDAIAFLYLSQYDQQQPFHPPLSEGIETAYREITGQDIITDTTFNVNIREPSFQRATSIINKVEEYGVQALTNVELGVFVRLCENTDAIDLDALREGTAWRLTHEDTEWWREHRQGKVTRQMSSGKWTPWMDQEIAEEISLWQMSERELRELFGTGYPLGVGPTAVCDGDVIYLTTPPSKRDDNDPEKKVVA